MEYYVEYNEKTMHYFWRDKIGLIAENDFIAECICKKSTEHFCVYANADGIHIICVSAENELIYIFNDGTTKRECVLCKLSDELKIKSICLAEVGKLMSFFYSAEYKNETVLVHCVLGDHAMPEIIDKIKNTHFFVFDSQVYYTNRAGMLGSRSFADGKPDSFIPFADGGEDIYFYCDGKEKYTVYKKGASVFVNGRKTAEDDKAERPIIVKHKGKTVLMWKSGAVVRYAETENLTSVKSLMSSGRQDLFCIQKRGEVYYDYRAELNE